MTHPSAAAFPTDSTPAHGLTKREWFAGQFAASGAYEPEGCVILADELIAALNSEGGK